jgi:hypothetical protein
VLRRLIESAQYLSIRYTERLAEADAVSSVGSRGDSYGRDVRRPGPRAATSHIPPDAALPGGSAVTEWVSATPRVPGLYLVILEVVTPGRGSLSTQGVPPLLIAIEVTAAG